MVRKIKLREIYQDGSVTGAGKLTAKAKEICQLNAVFYNKSGFRKPWISYLAFDGEIAVGSCAFKGAPKDGSVEIAYTTFTGFEGKGFATAMATSLIRIARQQDSSVRVFACTMAEENASNAVLRKLDFEFTGETMRPEDGKIWQWHLRK